MTPAATSEVVGRGIRVARNARGLTLNGLAGLLVELGWPLSINALSKIERAERRIDVDDLFAIATVLQVDASSLLPKQAGTPENVEQMRWQAVAYQAECVSRACDALTRTVQAVAAPVPLESP
jgi:transcriptional regulator with XRE-family HTH domain